MSLVRVAFILGLALLFWPFHVFGQVARVTTSNGSVMPDARTVVVESASLPGDGLIVVRTQQGGALGQLGVRAGESTNLRVPLTRTPAAGKALVVTLHADYGRRGVYDPADPAVLSVDIPASVVAAARR